MLMNQEILVSVGEMVYSSFSVVQMLRNADITGNEYM